jgi:large subunit ribosomal protein L15
MKAGFRGMSSRNARMPKRRGFTNIFKVENQVVKLAQLSGFESGSTVNAESLVAAGIIPNEKTPVKILGNGELTVALNVVGLKASATAKGKIEAAGGSVAGSESPESESPEEVSDDSGSA